MRDGGVADVDVEMLLALRGSDDAATPSPASLIHAERACHSDPRLCMCQKILRSGRKREKWKKRWREASTNSEDARIKGSISVSLVSQELIICFYIDH